jgi:malic enzyme
MVMAAAEALPKLLTDAEKERRAVYPNLANIRTISKHMALEIIKAAAEEDMVDGPAAARLAKGDNALLKWIGKHMYQPEYKSVVYLPVGVAE